ncbi:hypothetical protein ACU639_05220 [Streptomyces cynarae]|uniref:hypothetical protein n=1 Tax=Streptomyces cynarae TaxID=2981134 RepID=UPI00406C3013
MAVAAIRRRLQQLVTAQVEHLTSIRRHIRYHRSRGRWPEPDDTSSRAHRWYGATVNRTLAERRAHTRHAEKG